MLRVLFLFAFSLSLFGQTSTYVAGSRTFEGSVNFLGSDSGSGNSFVVTSNSDSFQRLKGYHQGACYLFRATHDNTGAATLNVDAIGAIAIKRIGGADLQVGDILNDSVVHACHNGTYVQLMSVVPSGSTDVAANALVNTLPVQMYQTVADYGLSTWTAALNNAASQVVNVVLFSDSIGVCYQPACGGQGATSANLRYAEQLKTYFESRGLSHGTGLKPLQISVSGNVINSTYWSSTGTWGQSSLIGPTQTTTGGQTGSSLAQFSSGATATFLSQRYDHLNVYCATNSSSTGFSVTIDGTGAGNACGSTTGSPTAQVFTFNTSGLTSHTAVLTALGNNSYLYGADGTIGTTGVSVHMVGQAGAVAEMFGVNPTSQNAFSDIIPGGTHLAIITFGTNEPISNITVSTYTTTMTSLISHEKALSTSPSILVWNEPPNGLSASMDTLPQYWSVAKSLAISNGLSFLSAVDRWVSYARANANGLIQADTVHLTNSGNNEMRAMLGKQILGFDPGAIPSGSTLGGTINQHVTIQASDSFPQFIIQGVPGFVSGVASLSLIPSDDSAEWRWYAWGAAGGSNPGLLQLVNGKNDHSPLFIDGDSAHHSEEFTHSGVAPQDMSAFTCDSGGEGSLSYIKGSGSTTGQYKGCVNSNGTYAWSPIGSGSGTFTGGTITGQTTVETSSGFPQFNIHGVSGNTSGVAGFNMKPADNTISWSWYSWGTGSGFGDRLLQLVNTNDDSSPFYVEHDAVDKAFGITHNGAFVTGKLGIGIHDPSFQFEVKDPSFAVAQLWNSDDSTGAGSYVQLMTGTTGSTPTSKWSVAALNAANGALYGSSFIIKDEEASGSTNHDRFLIAHSGRVGIGGDGDGSITSSDINAWRSFGLYVDNDGLTINSPNQSSTCDSDHRFLMRTVPGGTGVADKFQVCVKDASNAYAFVDK